MAQWVKALTAKPDDVSLVTWMPHSGNRELTIEWSSVFCNTVMCTHTKYMFCLFFKIRGIDEDKEKHPRAGEEMAEAKARGSNTHTG